MSDDLIKRLNDLHRQATVEKSHYYVGKCVEEAADHIEALEAENARLRGALERYADESNWIETSAANDDPYDGRLRDIWDGGADGWTEARAALQEKETTND